MLKSVDRILIRVTALPAAVRHYRDTLGLKLLREDKHLAVFQLADAPTQLVIHDDPDLPTDAAYILVDDVRDMHRRKDELNLTFVSPPTAVSRGYRATVRDAFGAVMLLIDHSTATDAIEDARPATGLFPGFTPRASIRRTALIDAYVKVNRTADDLPYTPHFEAMYENYIHDQPEPKPDRSEVWRHLLTIRKAGELPKIGEAPSKPPELSAEDKAQLIELLGKDKGKRDRLPYSQRFEEIAEAFNKGRRRAIAAHQLWRAIATLTK